MLFLFYRVQSFQQKEALDKNKRIRRGIYTASAAAMIIAAGFFVARKIGYIDKGIWEMRDGTFWVETTFLTAFAASWLVKGRFFDTLLLDPVDKPETAG